MQNAAACRAAAAGQTGSYLELYAMQRHLSRAVSPKQLIMAAILQRPHTAGCGCVDALTASEGTLSSAQLSSAVLYSLPNGAALNPHRVKVQQAAKL